MKALVLHGIDDLRPEDVAEPLPGPNEVLVAVKAAGICGSDIPRIFQTGAHTHPLIPGHEFSGVVVKTGTGAGGGWLGKRVGVYPLIPCKACAPCLKNRYEMCRHYDYLGSRRDGAFAEYVTVPEDNLIELPEGVSFEGAAMLEPMSVAVHAMRRIAPDASDTVAVCGLGTIGMLLLMFLLEAGISDILVIGNKDFQKEAVLKLGIAEDSFCDARKQDTVSWILEHTAGVGAQAFFECVGKNETLVQAVNGTAPAGKIMLVGNPFSDMELKRDVYWKILRNQLTVMGTWNSSFTHEPEDDWHYVLRRLAQKGISPETLISHRFSLDELWRGLCIMRNKTEDYGKIMAMV